jgi:AcrR family transcriptional regulator
VGAKKIITSDERRAQIALTAADLFAKKGFNGVTTKEIAEKAKVNEALIFRHFPNKDALYSEIINQKVKIKPEMFNVEAARAGDDRGVFSAVANFIVKEMEADSTFLRLMLFSALEGHSLSSLFVKGRIRMLFGFLINYIDGRIKEGAFKKIDPAVVARAFMGMVFHFVMSEQLFDTPKFLRVKKGEAINGFVRVLLSGVVA